MKSHRHRPVLRPLRNNGRGALDKDPEYQSNSRHRAITRPLSGSAQDREKSAPQPGVAPHLWPPRLTVSRYWQLPQPAPDPQPLVLTARLHCQPPPRTKLLAMTRPRNGFAYAPPRETVIGKYPKYQPLSGSNMEKPSKSNVEARHGDAQWGESPACVSFSF